LWCTPAKWTYPRLARQGSSETEKERHGLITPVGKRTNERGRISKTNKKGVLREERFLGGGQPPVLSDGASREGEEKRPEDPLAKTAISHGA